MPKAAYCSECQRVVWMTDTGCESGHPMSCLRNVHETQSIVTAPSVAASQVRSPSVPRPSFTSGGAPTKPAMAWWIKALIFSVLWVVLTIGIGIAHTDVILAGQITREQGSAISQMYGMICGVGLGVGWALAYATRAREWLRGA